MVLVLSHNLGLPVATYLYTKTRDDVSRYECLYVYI